MEKHRRPGPKPGQAGIHGKGKPPKFEGEVDALNLPLTRPADTLSPKGERAGRGGARMVQGKRPGSVPSGPWCPSSLRGSPSSCLRGSELGGCSTASCVSRFRAETIPSATFLTATGVPWIDSVSYETQHEGRAAVEGNPAARTRRRASCGDTAGENRRARGGGRPGDGGPGLRSGAPMERSCGAIERGRAGSRGACDACGAGGAGASGRRPADDGS